MDTVVAHATRRAHAQRHLVGLLIAGAAALALAACNESNTYVPPPPPKVVIAQPVKQSVTRYLEVTGNTAAINEVDLEARVQGWLEEINYKDGTLVKKDTLLFAIEPDTYKAQLDQAKASLASAQAQQLNSQVEYTRQSTLGKSEFSSQAHVDDAKAKLDVANADVATAEANVEIATINVGYTQVTAPFDGIVTRHLVDVGALVGYDGPTKLATIVQMDPMQVYFNVSETVVLRIKEGLAKEGRTVRDIRDVPVEIGLQTEEGFPHKGHLDYIAPDVDPSTGTLEARAVFDNKDLALLPGLFVRVRIPLQTLDDSLLVPDIALGTNQLGKYLLVVGKDDIVAQKSVAVGELYGDLRVIESGLEAEDWVITDGVQRSIPGNAVAPEKTTLTVASGS